jgi:hypothetical protein
MSVWTWIAVGVGSFLLLSLVVGLLIGAILGEIGRLVSELHESEDWATAPPTRARGEVEPEPEEAKAEKDGAVHPRR